MDAIESTEELAQDIQAYLGEMHADMESAQMGEECEFESDAHYEQAMPSSANWHDDWRAFTLSLRQQTRFFNQFARDHLNEVFKGIEDMKTKNGGSVIVEAGPECEITGFYRARVFYKQKDVEAAMKRPDLHLAPPPSEAARAGRMNAHGISVFYGSDTKEGALSEVRPPVGSETLIVRFALTRKVRLLDFSALQHMSDGGSVFDPECAHRLSRMNFIRTLKHTISRPVMPTDEEAEYLPTQAVADFLATAASTKLDGVLFPSVQTGEASTNVVLFHKASFVEKLDIPEGTEISAQTYLDSEDGPEPFYWVSELVPPTEQAAKEPIQNNSINFMNFVENWELRDERDPTLRVESDSLTVHLVDAISYNAPSMPVQRHRYEKPVKEEF